MQGVVEAVFRYPVREQPPEVLDEAAIEIGLGLVGDSHARPPLREVLLASSEVIESLDLKPGDIRENLTVSGLDVDALAPGTHVSIGEVVLEITKPCEPCLKMDAIRYGLRRALEGRRGSLAKVVTGGVVRRGDAVQV